MANQSTDPAGSNLDRRRGVDRRAPHPAVGGDVSAPAAEPARSGLAPAADVAAAAQLACLLEATAPKPGNVSPTASFHDATYGDFLAGLRVQVEEDRELGATIYAAVEATTRWTRSNTNLGLVLLLAPLARAALRPGSAPLRAKLAATLAETTVADARDAYAAIRLAAPGGLGRAPEQDVAHTPTVPLGATMALAAERDAIAREYVTEFRATFEVGVAALRRALGSGLGWPEATVEAYLALLAAAPDTHIARKLGAAEAAAVQRRAQEVLAAGGVRTPAGRDAITALDRELRHERNRRNPGATADLTGAAICVVLLEGGWRRGGGTNGSA